MDAYFAYFNTIIKYGILLGGNSTDIVRVFLLQWRIIRTMAGVGSRCSCRGLFRKHICVSVCVCALIFVANNLETFQTNSSVHGMNTRNKTHLHGPVAKPSCFQKDVSYSCIKIFNIKTY